MLVDEEIVVFITGGRSSAYMLVSVDYEDNYFHFHDNRLHRLIAKQWTTIVISLSVFLCHNSGISKG